MLRILLCICVLTLFMSIHPAGGARDNGVETSTAGSVDDERILAYLDELVANWWEAIGKTNFAMKDANEALNKLISLGPQLDCSTLSMRDVLALEIVLEEHVKVIAAMEVLYAAEDGLPKGLLRMPLGKLREDIEVAREIHNNFVFVSNFLQKTLADCGEELIPPPRATSPRRPEERAASFLMHTHTLDLPPL